MKKPAAVVLLLMLVLAIGWYARRQFHKDSRANDNTKRHGTFRTAERKLKDGDIIFQTSRSRQSKAIQLATRSKYSHCGIVFTNGDDYVVYEAIEPVRVTPLAEWIARGAGGHYVVKRLANESLLTAGVLTQLKQACEKYEGRHYDLSFDWSDDKIYCSELVWKAYQEATGLSVGKLERLRDFDLNSAVVRQTLKQRYGNNIPLNETVISPVTIFNSELLETVMNE